MNLIERKIRNKSALSQLKILLSVETSYAVASYFSNHPGSTLIPAGASQENTWLRIEELKGDFPATDKFRGSSNNRWIDIEPITGNEPLNTFLYGPENTCLWVALWGEPNELEDLFFNQIRWQNIYCSEKHDKTFRKYLMSFFGGSDLKKTSESLADFGLKNFKNFHEPQSMVVFLSQAIAIYRMCYLLNTSRVKPCDLTIYEMIMKFINSEKVTNFLDKYLIKDLVKKCIKMMEEKRLNLHPLMQHYKNRIGWYQENIREDFLESPTKEKGNKIFSSPIEESMRLKRNIRLSEITDPWGKYLSEKATEYFEKFVEVNNGEIIYNGFVEFYDPVNYPNEIILNILKLKRCDIEKCESENSWPKVTNTELHEYLFERRSGHDYKLLDIYECFGEDMNQYQEYEGGIGVYFEPGQYWSRLSNNLSDLLDFEKRKPIGKLAEYLATK